MKVIKFFTTLVILFITLSINAQYFRGAEWGSSMTKIMYEEQGLKMVQKTENQLLYELTTDNQTTLIYYNFIDNKLYECGQMLVSKYNNIENYIIHFDNIENYLCKELKAKPDITQICLNRNTENSYGKNESGKALINGDLQIRSIWHLKESVIVLNLKGIDKEPMLWTSFVDINMYMDTLE